VLSSLLGPNEKLRPSNWPVLIGKSDMLLAHQHFVAGPDKRTFLQDSLIKHKVQGGGYHSSLCDIPNTKH
jgi:hypothetical protein